jgi:ribosome-binding factor A
MQAFGALNLGFSVVLWTCDFWGFGEMATDRRVARVAELMRREASQLLMNGIKDDRVGTGMVSVTDVVVSGDLQHAKIFVSIYGSDEDRATTMEGLNSATRFVRSQLGQRMGLRRTPEVVFVEDISLARGTEMLTLINRLTEDRKQSGVETWLDEAAARDRELALEEEAFDEEEDEDEEDDLGDLGDLAPTPKPD